MTMPTVMRRVRSRQPGPDLADRYAYGRSATALRALPRMSSERLTFWSRAAVASLSRSLGNSRTATSSVRCRASDRLRDVALTSEVVAFTASRPFCPMMAVTPPIVAKIGCERWDADCITASACRGGYTVRGLALCR